MNFSNTFSHGENGKHIAAISVSINFVVGLPTNGYVLWLIGRGVSGTMTSEIFTLNSTVAEILYCLFGVLSVVHVYLPSLDLKYFVLFSSGLVSFGRSLFQSFICMERYLAVVHPVVFLRYKPLRYRLGCCVVIWAVIIAVCCISVLYGENTRVMFRIYLSVYLLFLSINLFFSLSVLRALKQPKPGDQGFERERDRGSDIKMKAFKIILLILVSMLIYYLSWIVVFIVSELSMDNILMDSAMVCFSVTMMTGFIQPLLYLHRTGRLPCIRSL